MYIDFYVRSDHTPISTWIRKNPSKCNRIELDQIGYTGVLQIWYESIAPNKRSKK